MSCTAIAKLSWPSCSPDPSKGILECSDTLGKDVECCLTKPTRNKLQSECPDGYKFNNPAEDWCTSSYDWNPFDRVDKTEYRQKCKRVTPPPPPPPAPEPCPPPPEPCPPPAPHNQCERGSFFNENEGECQSCEGQCFRPECAACEDNKYCKDFGDVQLVENRRGIEEYVVSKPTYQCTDCTGDDCRHGCTCDESKGLSCQYNTQPWSSWDMSKLAAEDKKNCVCEFGKKWNGEECVACDATCNRTRDGKFYENEKNNCGMCGGTGECDTNTFTCSDTVCQSDNVCNKRGTGYCVMRSSTTLDKQYTCSQDYCNPDGGDDGKQCSATQICAHLSTNPTIVPYRCSDTYCSSDDDCVKHGFENRKCDLSPLHTNPEYNTCVENYCDRDQDCEIGKCVSYRCNKNCITTDPPLTMGMYPVDMKKSNTAYAHAPQEMYPFYTDYPYDGVWGFIQTSGNQVFAQGSMRQSLGVENAGYRNSEQYYEKDNRWDDKFTMFNNPQGLAVCKTATPEGKYRRPIIFVADTGNHCIRMINVTINWTGGNYNYGQTQCTSTLTGSNWGKAKSMGDGVNLESVSDFKDGTLDVALFNGPTGLDFDDSGVLYVADTGNNKLRKIVIDQADINIADKNRYPFDITGTVSTLDVGPLNAPRGVLFHKGMLYVSDNSTIRRIDVAKNTVELIARDLNYPYGLAISGKNLLFSDAEGVKILMTEGIKIPRTDKLQYYYRPLEEANFGGKRTLALINYRDNIVVGLEGATAVQISGNKCTCFPNYPGNCP